MLKKKTVTPIWIAALASASIAGPQLASAQDDVAQIEGIWDAYEAAAMASDAEAWLALWDEEGVQMPPGIPARGRDILVEAIPKSFAAAPTRAMTILPEETVVADDWAFSTGTFTAEREMDGQTRQIDGKFLSILKRQDDGSWRIYRDAFNSNK